MDSKETNTQKMEANETMHNNTPVIPYVSLCSGYEGIGLGLHSCIPNLRCIAYCEREAFAVSNLVAKMESGLLDAAPVFTDVTNFPWEQFAPYMAGGILSFGWPCQPVSTAGKRKATEDERWLFDIIADGIALMRPGWLFAENVEGLLSARMPDGSSVFGHCVERLEALHYHVEAGIFSASECGAPHQRKRVFILAVSNSLRGAAGISRSLAWNEGISREPDNDCYQAWPSRPCEPQHDWEPPRVVADGKKHGWAYQRVTGDLDCETGSEAGRRDQPASPTSDCGDAGTKTMGDTTQLFSNGGDDHRGVSKQSEKVSKPRDPSWEGVGDTNGTGSQEWTGQRGAGVQRAYADGRTDAERQTQLALGRNSDGSADRLDDAKLYVTCDNRTDELRLLGNGVVPATAEKAFRTLMQTLHE